MRPLLIALFVSWFSDAEPAFEADPPSSRRPACVTLRHEQIGQLPLAVEVGGTHVQFLEWTAKDADAHELVGFRASPGARIEVTAGDETWLVDDGQWLQPHGVVGRRAAPISAVTLCPSSLGS